MIELSRRGFLTGLVATAAVAVAASPASLLASIPTLYADGIQDDTLALQSLLDGKPIIRDGLIYTRRLDDVVRLVGGNFRITDTLEIGNNHKTHIEGGYFRYDGPDDGRPMLGIGSGKELPEVVVANCHFDTGGKGACCLRVRKA